jgi:hypothetical protein
MERWTTSGTTAATRFTRATATILPLLGIQVGERRIDPIEFIAWCRTCGIDAAAGIEQVQR